jgi:hypothetical protein
VALDADERKADVVTYADDFTDLAAQHQLAQLLSLF